MIVPTKQPPSVPCSNHLELVEGSGGGELGEECRLSFVHRNVIKLTYSFLMPGDIVNLTGLFVLIGFIIPSFLI